MGMMDQNFSSRTALAAAVSGRLETNPSNNKSLHALLQSPAGSQVTLPEFLVTSISLVYE